MGIRTIDTVLDGGLETGCLHEISSAASQGASKQDASESAAACGFAAHLLAAFSARGPVIWILPRRTTLYAPGLAGLGLHPRRLLVVEARERATRLWALAEALRWENAAAVLAEIDPVDFNISRRLQLAAAASGVTGLLLHEGGHAGNAAPDAVRPAQASAARTRWRVAAAQSAPVRELATAGGLGPPRWRLELRRGPAARRGSWLVEQSNEGLIHVQTADLERAVPAPPCRQQRGGVVISASERAAASDDDGRHAHARSVAAAPRDRSRLARGG